LKWKIVEKGVWSRQVCANFHVHSILHLLSFANSSAGQCHSCLVASFFESINGQQVQLTDGIGHSLDLWIAVALKGFGSRNSLVAIRRAKGTTSDPKGDDWS
jgi:hypothetical protein